MVGVVVVVVDALPVFRLINFVSRFPPLHCRGRLFFF